MTAISSAIAMRPRRLGHANLFVGELERSVAFYNSVLGLELVRREPEIEAGFLSAGTTHHDVGLMQAANKPRIGLGGHVQIPTGRGNQPGLNHFGWEMETEAELVAAWRRARAAGLEIHRTTNHQISHSVYLFDPEGNLNEFYADALKGWRSIFNPEQESLVSGHWDPEAAPPSEERNYAPDPEIRVVQGAVFHPVRITHAVLGAHDFGRLRDFYGEVAGLTAVEERSGRWALLRGAAGEADLGLVAGAPAGLRMIAFRLDPEEDLERCRAELAARGIGPVRRLDRPTKRALVMTDPDGVVVELYQPLNGSVPVSLQDCDAALA